MMSLHVLLLFIRQNQKKIKSLLTNKNNKIIYDKKKDNSQRTSSSMVLSVLNDPSFFDNSIHQNEPVVNTSDKKTLTDAEYMFAVKRGDLHSWDANYSRSWRYNQIDNNN